jgi:hypothetical protein
MSHLSKLSDDELLAEEAKLHRRAQDAGKEGDGWARHSREWSYAREEMRARGLEPS